MRTRRERRGVALVTVLALLALASALLAGGFASATATARAARSARAGIIASTAARRTIGEALIAWSVVEDRLAVGGSVTRAVSIPVQLPRDAADTRVRVQRLSPSLFVIAADATVPATGIPLARRRLRLLVRRPIPADSTMISVPRALTRWAFAELF